MHLLSAWRNLILVSKRPLRGLSVILHAIMLVKYIFLCSFHFGFSFEKFYCITFTVEMILCPFSVQIKMYASSNMIDHVFAFQMNALF